MREKPLRRAAARDVTLGGSVSQIIALAWKSCEFAHFPQIQPICFLRATPCEAVSHLQRVSSRGLASQPEASVCPVTPASSGGGSGGSGALPSPHSARTPGRCCPVGYDSSPSSVGRKMLPAPGAGQGAPPSCRTRALRSGSAPCSSRARSRSGPPSALLAPVPSSAWRTGGGVHKVRHPVSAFVHSGCCQNDRLGGFPSHGSGGRTSKVRAPADSVSGEDAVLVHRRCLSPVSTRGRGGGTNPLVGAPSS